MFGVAFGMWPVATRFEMLFKPAIREKVHPSLCGAASSASADDGWFEPAHLGDKVIHFH